MYRKILVPTDGSVLSEKAITAAIEFARKHPGCRIIGFSVAEPLSFNQIESLTKSGESDYMVREQLSAQSRRQAFPAKRSSLNRQNLMKRSFVHPMITIATAFSWHPMAEKV